MNNARYSNKVDTNFDYLSLIPLMNSVFSQKPPFDIYKGQSHRELARKTTQYRGIKIYVYKNNEIVKGSPFSSSAQTYKTLKLSFEKIKLYLDTNIEIEGYLLYSFPKF